MSNALADQGFTELTGADTLSKPVMVLHGQSFEMLYPSDFTPPPRILAGIIAPLALPICAKVANTGIGSID